MLRVSDLEISGVRFRDLGLFSGVGLSFRLKLEG